MRFQKSYRLLALFTLALLFVIAFASPCVAVSYRVELIDLAPPSPTSISCSVLPASLTLGNSTAVSGSISPGVSNVTVTVTYTKPDATTVHRTATTGADGSFSDTYTPDVAGSWSVKASWAGNDVYFGSTSFDATFTVTAAPVSGFPIEYVYVTVISVIVVVAAVAAYWYKRKK